MKKLLFILIIFCIYLTSCKQCEPTYIHVNIRDTIIKVIPKIIIDSGKAQIVNDTLIQYVSVKNNDTIIKIKYYPKTKLVNVYAKPEPEYIIYKDTVTTIQIKEVIKETPLKDFFMYVMGFILLACLIYFLYKHLESKFNAVNTK
jgi:hypothetical protein